MKINLRALLDGAVGLMVALFWGALVMIANNTDHQIICLLVCYGLPLAFYYVFKRGEDFGKGKKNKGHGHKPERS